MEPELKKYVFPIKMKNIENNTHNTDIDTEIFIYEI